MPSSGAITFLYQRTKTSNKNKETCYHRVRHKQLEYPMDHRQAGLHNKSGHGYRHIIFPRPKSLSQASGSSRRQGRIINDAPVDSMFPVIPGATSGGEAYNRMFGGKTLKLRAEEGKLYYVNQRSDMRKRNPVLRYGGLLLNQQECVGLCDRGLPTDTGPYF